MTKETSSSTLKRKQEALQQSAAEYRNLMLQIKELEKKAAPLKQQLVDYAKGICLVTLDLGAVTLERRSSLKASIDRDSVTPDWLWRMQRDGCFGAVTIAVDPRKLPAGQDVPAAYLSEIGYREKESLSYAIRLNPETPAKP